jgi:hypothetical protein
MANYVFGDAALGKVGAYVEDVLAGGNDAIIWIPMATSGTAEQAETLTTFSAVEADANFSEQTGTGWSRITQDETGDSLAYTYDATNNREEADSADLVWAAPSSGNTVGLIACYDPDTTAGTDTTLVPLVHLDMVVTANGQQVTFQFNAEGWYNATRA